ncbi:MAG: cupin domain-containing protein [Clostridia bacterium]|nr:cupin domain-containing protein [Clostridia bacterium]MBR2878635.1 cupin domain-containing protein [Clostridia bacterium]MBR3576263.1 cupin domain-containing protein [Clostridia bacterium]
MEKRYDIAGFENISAVPCPCGMSKRAYIDSSDGRVSFHIVEIKKDAERHYHKNHIEIYYILEGEGFIEADGEMIPAKPGTSVMIKEYCRHKAHGEMKIANVSLPAFDPEDEYFD